MSTETMSWPKIPSPAIERDNGFITRDWSMIDGGGTHDIGRPIAYIPTFGDSGSSN